MIVQRPLRKRDLAPGDMGSLAFDWTGFRFIEVSHPDDPDFERLYQAFDEEFGPRREMETREVLRERLSWSLTQPRAGYHMRYRMLAVEKSGELAGLHDHTIIVKSPRAPRIYVHLSHILIALKWRRTGLAGWMRAFPLADARQAGIEVGFSENIPTILIAEMEPFKNPDQLPRLLAYARAGFRCADPKRVKYHQPDFRPETEIDENGGPEPLPLWLMLRTPGHENLEFLTGLEIRQIITALHAMYAQTFREQDMAVLSNDLKIYHEPHEQIALQDIRLPANL